MKVASYQNLGIESKMRDVCVFLIERDDNSGDIQSLLTFLEENEKSRGLRTEMKVDKEILKVDDFLNIQKILNLIDTAKFKLQWTFSSSFRFPESLP